MSLFGALEELRTRPIGDQAGARAARQGFRSRIKLARDNALFPEAVVEARDVGLKGANFYAGDRNPPYWQRIEGATQALWLRKSVAEKLLRVNARAGAVGLELFLFDAWRPRAVQAYFHDVWMPRELQRLISAISQNWVGRRGSDKRAQGDAVRGSRTQASRSASGMAPAVRAISRPRWQSTRLGMLRTAKRAARSGSASVSTFE